VEANCSVVDKYMQAAELRKSLLDRAFGVGWLRHVGDHRQHNVISPRQVQVGDGLAEHLSVDIQ
jgi:hypothetical protein